jgi:hypothetical protein
MNSKTLLSVALCAAIIAGAAHGQSAKPKLYRWVDKEGKVHYDDALPPEAVNQARTEFSAKNGTETGEVARALTPEERAQIAAAAAASADADKLAAEQKHQEEVMLATYSNENDLRRAYGERLDLLKTTLESTDVSIKNVRENLALMLQQASDSELAGRKVPPERLKAIQELHAEHLRQQQFLVNRRIELDALNGEFARMLERYRVLKNPAAPAAPAPLSNASAAPPAAPPPGGGF